MSVSRDIRFPPGDASPKTHTGCCGHQPHAAMGGARDTFRSRLPANHVLAVLMDEHARILAQLDQLERLATDLPSKGGMVFARIEALGRELIGVEPHHQREEKVLFPALQAVGIDGPPSVMVLEHVEMRALEHQIVELAAKGTMGDTSAIAQLRGVAAALVSTLRAHIDKEDNILYPMALAAIAEPAWAELSAQCDAIGYCCGHKE